MSRITAVFVVTDAPVPFLKGPVSSAERRESELSLASGTHVTLIIRAQSGAAPETEFHPPASLPRPRIRVLRLRRLWRVGPHLHLGTKDFSKRFADYISTRCAEKPNTVEFYAFKMARLLDFQPLAIARLNKIDEALIEAYVQWRRKKVSPASVNRELATLRRALRLAYSWKEIDRVPMIHLLPGERVREFILSQEQEWLYLEFAPQPMRDIATLILDTGLRVGEALGLEWRDVKLTPANGAKYGFVHIRGGKSRNAERNIPLTPRVKTMLEPRRTSGASWVFADGHGGPTSRFTVRDQHAGLRQMLRLPKDAVIHSLRHTALTRLGESGADAFTIMRIAGHSSVVVSQRYVHPSPASIEAAFDRLEALNRKAQKELSERGGLGLTTISTTSDCLCIDDRQQAV